MCSVLGAPMNVTATANSPTSIMVTWTHPMFMNTIDDYFIVWEQFGLPAGVLREGGSEEILCDSVNSLITKRKRNVHPPCVDFTSFNITDLAEYTYYNVSVIASNDAGESARGFDTALTMSAGMFQNKHIMYSMCQCCKLFTDHSTSSPSNMYSSTRYPNEPHVAQSNLQFN